MYLPALDTFRYPEIRYPLDIFKVPKVPDKWGLFSNILEFISIGLFLK